MVVPPLQDGVCPLDIWGLTLWSLQIGDNLLRGNLRLVARFRSERPPGGLRHSMGHVPVMFCLASEGGECINKPERLLWHPLGSGRAGAW